MGHDWKGEAHAQILPGLGMPNLFSLPTSMGLMVRGDQHGGGQGVLPNPRHGVVVGAFDFGEVMMQPIHGRRIWQSLAPDKPTESNGNLPKSSTFTRRSK